MEVGEVTHFQWFLCYAFFNCCNYITGFAQFTRKIMCMIFPWQGSIENNTKKLCACSMYSILVFITSNCLFVLGERKRKWQEDCNNISRYYFLHKDNHIVNLQCWWYMPQSLVVLWTCWIMLILNECWDFFEIWRHVTRGYSSLVWRLGMCVECGWNDEI